MARQKRTPETRQRVLAAAAAEFAAHGFAAARVDRIARHAHVNKAMIYYHFASKQALYTAILREIYLAVGERLQCIAASASDPARKLDGLIETLVAALDARPYFLPMFLRELAEGGRHLGREELSLIAAIFATVTGVIAEGVRAGEFRAVHPALAHFTLIGPLIMFRASAPVRARIQQLRKTAIPDADSEALVRHLQLVARRMLAPQTVEDNYVRRHRS